MAKSKKKTSRKISKAGTPTSNGDGKQSKGAVVREYLAAHPAAKASEVIAALKAKGVEVSANYVSLIKSKRLAKASGPKSKVAAADMSTHGQLEAAVELLKACRWDFESARHFVGLIEKVHTSLK